MTIDQMSESAGSRTRPRQRAGLVVAGPFGTAFRGIWSKMIKCGILRLAGSNRGAIFNLLLLSLTLL